MSDQMLCYVKRRDLKTLAPLANPTIAWKTVLLEKQWLFTSENKERLPWNVSSRITGASWVKRGERGIFSRNARRGEEKKILPSSRASREMQRSSNLAHKAPVMQATETQVKLHIITSRSQEKNAKPMSARSPNSFPFELSKQLNLYVWLRDRDKFCCLYSCTRSNHWWKMVLFCFFHV